MVQFKSLKDFMAYFKDEKTCWDYLESKCWQGNPICPHCGCTKVYRLSNYKQFKCGNYKGCDKKFTVLVGTVMENTKIPLTTWMASIYLFTSYKKGISSCQLSRTLGITQKSAWYLLHRIREMVKPQTQIELTGTVMADETYVKGLNKNRTYKQKKLIKEGKRLDRSSIVLGMVESNGNTVLKVIRTAEADSLHKGLDKTINKDALLVTDGHLAYRIVAQEYKGHIIINHSKGEYVNGIYSTNSIESVFSWFKRTIYGTYHFVSRKHMQRYCAMFSYRFNTRRFSDALRFETAMSKVQGGLTYKKLTA